MKRVLVLATSLLIGASAQALERPAAERSSDRGSDHWAERWAERALAEPIARGAASAATLSVVQSGRVVLDKSYGVADIAGRPVDPAHDRFLIASVTKIFTASLLMTFVADGHIRSLDDPVNRYLKRIQLARAYDREITIRHLLTHTAGFEERGFGYESRVGVSVPATADYIRSKLPAVVRAPGSRIVYANIDPPLIGAMLEDIAGIPLRELMRQRLFAPLGMHDSELVYDFTGGPRLIAALSIGRNGERTALPRDINAPFFAPTGSVHTTAADMAKFANALLGHRLDVLTRPMLTLLHASGARNAASLMGMGAFFFVGSRNGKTYVDHPGEFSGFRALLLLVPQADTGVFVAWAGGPAPGNPAAPVGFDIEDGLLDAITGPFVAPPPLEPQPDTTTLIGTYWNERRAHRSPEVLLALDDVTTVALDDQGRLMINGDGPYYSFAPGAFTRAPRAGHPGSVYAFAANEVRMTANYGVKVSGLGNPRVVRTILLAAIGVLLTGILALLWPEGRARLPGLAAFVLGLGYPFVLLTQGGIAGFVSDILQGNGWRFAVLRGVAIGNALLAVILPWLLLRRIRVELWPMTSRAHLATVHLAALAAAAVTVVSISRYLHLL